MLVLPSCTECQIGLLLITYCYSSHFSPSSLPFSHMKVKTLYRSPNPWSPRKHTLATNIVGLKLFGFLARPQVKLKPPLSPLSELSHLPAPVKLPQFLSVRCRPAHFLIEGCSEVQKCRGAQCASVFGLTQKCFSWLNSLVLRSSYNKLKGPNCPQGRGLATIDMWWDKSPVLIPRHPHPTPDRRDEHVSSVCFVLWVKRPHV